MPEEAARSAVEMDASAQALERRLAGASPRVAGTVRVAAPETLASAIVAPRLSALSALHPELRVELLAGAAAVNLPRREADVALRLFRPAEPTLVARRLCPIAFAVYASARYLATRKLTAAAPLSAHDVIAWDASIVAAPQGRWFEEATAGARVPLRTNSAYAMLAAARADLGAALLPCFLGDAERGLRRIVEPSAVSAPELWLVVHEDLRRAARIRAVVRALEQIIAGALPLLRGSAPHGRD